MICIFSEKISQAIGLLNEEPVTEDVTLHIVEGYSTIETQEGRGFGVYIPELRSIYVAGNLEDREIVFAIAHAFMHFMQHVSGSGYNEYEAYEYAKCVISKIFKK